MRTYSEVEREFLQKEFSFKKPLSNMSEFMGHVAFGVV